MNWVLVFNLKSHLLSLKDSSTENVMEMQDGTKRYRYIKTLVVAIDNHANIVTKHLPPSKKSRKKQASEIEETARVTMAKHRHIVNQVPE